MSTDRPVASFEVAVITNRELTRPLNEDVVAIDSRIFSADLESPVLLRMRGERLVLLVADGMGGHARGDLASRSAIQSLIANPDLLGDVEDCTRAVIAANDHVYEVMRRTPGSAAMGTTIAGVVLAENALVWFNVGDSRIYRFGNSDLELLSHDDVPESDAFGPWRSHAVTQSLGGYPSRLVVDPHVGTCPRLQSGEIILLCSDGLSDMVSATELAAALRDAPAPLDLVASLFRRAMEAGGSDNISIIAARLADRSA